MAPLRTDGAAAPRATVVVQTSNLIHTAVRLQKDTSLELAGALDGTLSQRAAAVVRHGVTVVTAEPESTWTALECRDVSRDELSVTAKLFLGTDVRRGHLRIALEQLREATGFDYVDTFVLSTSGNDAEDAPDDVKAGADAFPPHFLTAYLPLYQEMEELYAEGKIRRLGICDFTLAQMTAFLPLVKVAPSVNQVNLDNCCFLPKELIEFSKANKIELLTHGDRAEIIPTVAVRQHLLEHETLPVAVVEKLDVLWVLRYSVLVKQRGIASDKAYLVAASPA